MRRRVKQYGLLLVGAGVAVAVIAPAVIAATGDTEDVVKPASTPVTAKLKTGTKTKFVTTFKGATAPAILTCTGSSTSGTTPASGLSITVKPVSFTGCTDNLGGTDTVKTNSTNGAWKVAFVDAPTDETATEPNSGDKLRITIPQKGATVTPMLFPGCIITVAPSAAAQVTGAYNDSNTLTISSAPVPVSFNSLCPGGAGTSTAKFSGTYILSPGVHDAS